MKNMLKGLEDEKYSEVSDASGEDSFGDIETTNGDYSTSHLHSNGAEESRDEVREVHKVSRKDTRRVQMWRLATLLALVITGVAVTVSTYDHLKKAEQKNFATAFEQFARALGDAEVDHQRTMRRAYRTLAGAISSSAKAANATWPFYVLPRFEQYGHNVLSIAKTELIIIMNHVKDEERSLWEEWMEARYEKDITESYEIESFRKGPQVYDSFTPKGYSRSVRARLPNGTMVTDKQRDDYWCTVNFSPPPMSYRPVNYNMYPSGNPGEINTIRSAEKIPNEFVLGTFRLTKGDGLVYTKEEHEAKHSHLPGSSVLHPHTSFALTYHADPDDPTSEAVGFVYGLFAWDAAMQNLLPDNVRGIFAVLRNTCGQVETYRVDGSQAWYLGEGDHSEEKFRDYKRHYDLTVDYINPDFPKFSNHCMYSMDVHPSHEFEAAYNTLTPEIFAIIIASTFLAVIAIFFLYDWNVRTRNENLVMRAAQSNAIVANLFPGQIRDRLIGENANSDILRNRGSLKTFMKDGVHGGQASNADPTTKPLADFFPETSVIFADIVGFTAWSSTREPPQVFLLLESLYQSFDTISKRRRIFKVETVGDCYVAASGMPDQRKDHAVAICRFARDIQRRTLSLVKTLEKSLGPDTADLDIRIGIHSGPVTAGVLRGERARFQLFGDTMNTAARMESTGAAGRIHLSSATAQCLKEAGKENWIQKRSEPITAKGKGTMQTYWLAGMSPVERTGKKTETASISEDFSKGGEDLWDFPTEDEDTQRTARRVEWFVDSLIGILKQVVAHRNAKHVAGTYRPSSSDAEAVAKLERATTGERHDFLGEVQEIISLREFDREAAKVLQDPSNVVIDPVVVEQLRDFVASIASMYRQNEFHNFEHASHVTQSVLKLLSRIVAAELDDSGSADGALHDHTYGITSEPMMQFACAFSSLIHDVDHTGVGNAQLIHEDTALAGVYNNRTVAEQNSLDLSWNLLMDTRYKDLRATIYTNETELRRFRQLVVNSVMATDIADKGLKTARNARWDKAFKMDFDEATRDAVNRKATIVLEHLIQASDVSHTMQHWHIYRRWNERFFLENYKAWREGRVEQDPSDGWFKGEIGFFDFYVIPLAKKLKDCGVFGVSSAEYLNYAQNNRHEWVDRGEEVTAELSQKARELYGYEPESPSSVEV
ncbi:Receptor-type guanylate cyclase gcy [Seminavis robusta]|uniref:Receptor-type guanylate cyclase gcy n=1 Tax=Seminavis robusta TaxID=568900 RepID=A0A9N8EH13_9STRA|nr:Receptor-type guanylate cyclase gcy [Seminavis robusta]|eukprot:Sro1068_g237500.1 Receptor-type guanylate cyclase gcy (1168) ;mRNA; f:21620-26445